MPPRSGYKPRRRRGSARDARRGAGTPPDRCGMPPSSFRALLESRRRRVRSGGPRCGRWHRRRQRSRGRGECSGRDPVRRPRRGQRRRSRYRQRRSRRRTRYSARAHRDRRCSARDAPRASLEWTFALLSTSRPRRRMTASDAVVQASVARAAVRLPAVVQPTSASIVRSLPLLPESSSRGPPGWEVWCLRPWHPGGPRRCSRLHGACALAALPSGRRAG
jgi:hypothetical protein